MSSRRLTRATSAAGSVSESDIEDELTDVEGGGGTPTPQRLLADGGRARLASSRRSRTAMVCGSLAAVITVLNLMSILPLLRGNISPLVRHRAPSQA